jgi:hypothetical protein
MSALMVIALTGAVSACDDGTGPSGDDPNAPRVDVPDVTLARSQLVIDDVSLRLIPAVANYMGVAELTAAVSSLAQAVVERNGRSVLDNVARARTALAEVRVHTTSSHAADLDAIEIGIRDIELLVTTPPSS